MNRWQNNQIQDEYVHKVSLKRFLNITIMCAQLLLIVQSWLVPATDATNLSSFVFWHTSGAWPRGGSLIYIEVWKKWETRILSGRDSCFFSKYSTNYLSGWEIYMLLGIQISRAPGIYVLSKWISGHLTIYKIFIAQAYIQPIRRLITILVLMLTCDCESRVEYQAPNRP